MEEARLLSINVVGNGFSYQGWQAGVARKPHLVAGDNGSSDSGPYSLGTGEGRGSAQLKRDLGIMLQSASDLGVPFSTGSCGRAGGEVHLQNTLKVVEEVCKEKKLHFRVALIHAEQDKAYLLKKLAEGKITPLGPVAPLTAQDIETSVRIVGMMGVEPYIEALDQGAQVVLGGRAMDPAIFAGVPLRMGLPVGLCWHASKVIDKGHLATENPFEGSPILATITPDYFIIEPTKAGIRSRIQDVAGQTMYEQSSFKIVAPGGAIDTTDCVYEQIDERRVRVSGSKWIPSSKYTIKLEGSRFVGYRAVSLVGVRDPVLIEQIDSYLVEYHKAMARVAHSLGIAPDEYQLRLRVYGKNAVMGALEPNPDFVPQEVGICIDAVAKTQAIANTICGRADPVGSHLSYPGRLCTAGQFAYAFQPSVMQAAPVYEWSVWHVVETDSWKDMFQIEMVEI